MSKGVKAVLITVAAIVVVLAVAVLTQLPYLRPAAYSAFYAPPEAPDFSSRPAQQTQEIKIMSFNVYTVISGEHAMSKRVNGVTETIRSEMPDSFGLQEAHERWRNQLKRELRDDYAIACNKGRYFGFHEGTPIFYLKEKYELLEEDVFWLSEQPDRTSIGWDASLPRVVGYAVLRDKQTGFTYVHYNTHFDHKGEVAVVNSARLIADKINEMNLPAVLTGDLNCRPESLSIAYLAEGGLTDVRETAVSTDNGGTFHAYAEREGEIIDYILANQFYSGASDYHVIRDQYDGRYPSDHYAVVATLTLSGPAA